MRALAVKGRWPCVRRPTRHKVRGAGDFVGLSMAMLLRSLEGIPHIMRKLTYAIFDLNDRMLFPPDALESPRSWHADFDTTCA